MFDASQMGLDVDLDRKLELLDEQIEAAMGAVPNGFDSWRRKTEVVLRIVMGVDSPQLADFEQVMSKIDPGAPNWETALQQSGGAMETVAILQACQDEIQLIAERGAIGTDLPNNIDKKAATPGPVFIVHGHDGELKEQAARLVQVLTHTDATILHEQISGGKTILEKFEGAAVAAGFALVLLSADDLGGPRDGEPNRPRARQNVIFELGFFFGALGRARTVVLLDTTVERPSDIHGLVYIEHDRAGAWRTAVAKELEAGGYQVDWSAFARL